MTLKRKASGSALTITTKIMRNASGAFIDIDTIRRRASGAWTLVWKRITLSDQTVLDSVPSGGATAGYRLNSTGIAELLTGASYTTAETWLAGGASSGYECRATITFGSLTSGTTGSWLSISSPREWYVSRISSGSSQCTFTLEIRNASTLVVVASATIDLTAQIGV